MKPKFINVSKKREKPTCPGSILQTGMLIFSTTCGAALFLTACNGN
ncbi:MAG: hypothetical protein ACRCR1_06955 [Aeromonas sp.]